MVSQGAQTNGDKTNRRLMKSYSEVGQFGLGVAGSGDTSDLHEPLHRTQSEEPPRSPFVPSSPKEILIDFQPLEKRSRKRNLGKTVSDGEVLEAAREKEEKGDGATQSDGEACYQNTSIDEPSEKRSASSAFSGSDTTSPVKQLISADSQEEEFHENLVYGSGMFRKQSTAEDADSGLMSMADPKVTTRVQSPFASSDSLKDHSDGIWNESQTTILHADSDNNGAATGVSCSDLSSSLTPSAAIMSMTPSSRRKHLLMLQHQQRSSMDTEALDAEDLEIEQAPLSPRLRTEPMKTVPIVAVTTPIQEKGITAKPVIKNTLPYFKTRIEQSLSPSHRGQRRSPELRLPDQDHQQNDMLARSDSGKTNTDMSETSTTTEDYITATENNSGTDTSSRLLCGDSGPTATSVGAPSAAGSSFESGSSLYSFTRADAIEDMQQVPCSPPLIEEEKERTNEVGEDSKPKDVDSLSGDSSSSGSYSVDGSCGGEKQQSDGACSSAGEYESPEEDQSKSRSWTDEEKSDVKKGFKLELTPQQEKAISPNSALSPLQNHPLLKQSPNREIDPQTILKPKGKVPSPSQNSGKHTQTQVVVSNGMGGVSSDDSSGECACGHQRRTREGPRRKSGGRSPTSHGRVRRRSNNGEDSNRRRSSIAAAKSPSPVNEDETNTLKTNSHLYPDHESVRSAGGSPRRVKQRGITSPESGRLKALSAESLRSVSPGSDSVFYSEHSSGTATLTEQPICLHCQHLAQASAGINVSSRVSGVKEPIVQPPAGFADSPRLVHRDRAAIRLYKKADKRYRSEERRRHSTRAHVEAVRAKSEERGRDDKKEKMRPMTRSTDASMEKLRCSPNSLCSDDDDDCGIYANAYVTGSWVFRGDNELLRVWQRPNDGDSTSGRRGSEDLTELEQEFLKEYKDTTLRIIYRKSILEMYRRLASNSFESDKTVLVHRGSGDFGIRIHGSKPIVVSALEPGTSAETSGLEVGDILISINKINVLDIDHKEVVHLAHKGALDTLELEVARTSDLFSTGKITKPTMFGVLLRFSSSAWIPRYFVLKQDHCLYYYKTEADALPVGALNVTGYSISRLTDPPFGFCLSKKGALSVKLAANSAEKLEQWLKALSLASTLVEEPWLEESSLNIAATQIEQPECAGTLRTLVLHKGKALRRRFCVLKNACLYFYSDSNADQALGMACLHGYKVVNLTGKRFAFELKPPEDLPSPKIFYFFTDTEIDKKRWLAALEYSIARWFKVK